MRGNAVGRAGAIAAMLMLVAGTALAQSTSDNLPVIEVIGVAPVLGSGIDRDKVPGNTRSLSSGDLTRDGVPSLTGTLATRAPSIGITDVQNSPFQPDIEYRGFSASPVTGT